LQVHTLALIVCAGIMADGYPWLEIKCSRCKTPRAVDLAALRHVPTTRVHALAGRLRCVKCGKAGKRPAAELLQLWQRCPMGDENADAPARQRGDSREVRRLL